MLKRFCPGGSQQLEGGWGGGHVQEHGVKVCLAPYFTWRPGAFDAFYISALLLLLFLVQLLLARRLLPFTALGCRQQKEHRQRPIMEVNQ